MPRTATLWHLSVCLLVAALTASCGIRLPIDTRSNKPSPSNRSITRHGTPTQDPDLLVWLIADEYHTGMVVPYDWLLESGFIPPAGFGNPKFVTMSWGSRKAYALDAKLDFWLYARVICAPTHSVMEMIPSNWNVAEVCPQQRIWRKLVRRDRGPALAAFLNQCCATGPDGRPIVRSKSSWGNGVQLEGRYLYYIPRVCNVWTAQAIECLGGKMNPWFGLTADGIIRQVEKSPNNFEKIWDAYRKE